MAGGQAYRRGPKVGGGGAGKAVLGSYCPLAQSAKGGGVGALPPRFSCIPGGGGGWGGVVPSMAVSSTGLGRCMGTDSSLQSGP